MCVNLPLYEGAVHNRFELEQQKAEGGGETPRRPANNRVSPELQETADKFGVDIQPAVERGCAGEVGAGDAASFMAMFNSQYQTIQHNPDAR